MHEVVKLTAFAPRLFACIYYKLYMQQIRYVFSIKHGGLTLQILLFFIVSHRDALQYDTLFSFTFFVSLIVLYFLHSTSVLSFYLNAVLIISITALAPNAPKLQETVKITASGPLLVFCKYYKLYLQQI